MNNKIDLDLFERQVNEWLEHPDWYVRDVLGANLWEKQSEIVRSIFQYSNVAVKTCNSVGKSYVAARIVVTYLMLYPDSIVVTTAPTWNQVVNVLWREIASTVNKAKYKLTEKEVTQAGLNLDTKWYAVGVSTRTPDNMMGYHADNLLVVVDEAGGVDDLIFQGVRAITTNVNNKVLLIGNPTTPGGVFWNAFEPGSKYKQFTISAFDTPNFVANSIRTVEDLKTVFTPPDELNEDQRLDHYEAKKKAMNLPFPELIHPGDVYNKLLDWGDDSAAWQSLVMGEFPSQSEQSLLPTNLVSMAMNMYGIDEATGKTFAELSGWPIPEGSPSYGQDMARFGNDLNVLTPRHGGWVEKQIVWNKKGEGKLDLVESAKQILAIINPLDQNTRINIDDTGNGGGTTDKLREESDIAMQSNQPAHRYQLAAYNFGRGPSNPNKFHDITSELYWNLRDWFFKKQIALPYDKQLFNELVGRRWSITPQKKIRVESKDEYKKRTGGKSPDRSDSLALAFADGIREVVDEMKLTEQRAAREAVPVLQPIMADLMERY